MGVMYTEPPRDTVPLEVREDLTLCLPDGRGLLLLLFGVVLGRFGNFMIGTTAFRWDARVLPVPDAGRVVTDFIAVAAATVSFCKYRIISQNESSHVQLMCYL